MKDWELMLFFLFVGEDSSRHIFCNADDCFLSVLGWEDVLFILVIVRMWDVCIMWIPIIVTLKRVINVSLVDLKPRGWLTSF